MTTSGIKDAQGRGASSSSIPRSHDPTIPDLTHPQKAKQMFADRKTLGGEKMRKSAILATVAVLALAGCSKGSTDEASTSQADVAAAPAADAASAPAAGPEATDPFPYTAVISCGMNGFENLNVLACLSGDVDTEIEITNGENYGMYKAYNMPREWLQTRRGVEIPLAENFSIKMQNSDETLLMGLRIFDNDGKILFQKQTSQFGVISVSN